MDEVFRWSREAPEDWKHELYAIGGPPSVQAAYLDLVWWPGEPHTSGAQRQDVQRWCVVECLPLAALTRTHRHAAQARDLLKALHGPPPSTLRTWAVKNGHRVIQSRALVSQWQWELFRSTGCYVVPYWVIQGTHGGHLWMFPPAYQLLLRMSGRPLSPPAPGSLPYAPWDNRVRAQLGRERTLREWLERQQMTRDRTQKTAQDHKREDVALEKEGRRQLLAWLDEQMGLASDALGTHLAKQDLPTTPEGVVTDEQLEAETDAILASGPTNPNDL